MNRRKSALGLVILLLSCSDPDTLPSGDAGFEPGLGPVDVPKLDLGSPGAGALDASDTDAETPDASSPDGGAICPPNRLGCECVPVGGPNGTCFSRDHECRVYAGSTNGLCVRPCDYTTNGDVECAGEFAAGDTTRPASLCREGHEGGLCMEDERVGSGLCFRGGPRGERLVGCAPGWLCIDGLIPGRGYQGSCGRPCDTAGDCPPEYSYCHKGILAPPLTGVCSEYARGAGAWCRPDDITQICDATVRFPATTRVPQLRNRPVLTCIRNNFLDPQPEGLGLCFEVCDKLATPGNQCSTRAGACRDFPVGIADVGLCDDECDLFPNSCTGPGSGGLGETCTSTITVINGTASTLVGVCIDVLSPTIPEWNRSAPDLRHECRDYTDSPYCAAGTGCLPIGADAGPPLGCIRHCDPTAPTDANGCTGTSGRHCAAIEDEAADVGRCFDSPI